MTNSLILQFHWGFKQIAEMTLSDVTALLDSDELSRHQKAESEKFRVLLKTIARSK